MGFTTNLLSRLLNHIGRCHSSEPGFHVLCGIQECTRTYTNYNAFRNHVKKHHSILLDGEIGNGIIPEGGLGLDVDLEPEDLLNDEEHDELDIEREQAQIRRNNALCLMQIKEEGKLTQKNLDHVVNRTTQIVHNTIDMVKNGVAERLDAFGITLDDIPGLKEFFEEENHIFDPFKDIANFREQVKYYRENFNLVVSFLDFLLICLILTTNITNVILYYCWKRSWPKFPLHNFIALNNNNYDNF